MQAVNERDPESRKKLVVKAANQSLKASKLLIRHLNVVVPFGEIARSVDPQLSIRFHKHGHELLDDPEISQLPANRAKFGARLLVGSGYINMRTLDHKRAWGNYQLALDHLALLRLEKDSSKNYLEQHDRLFEKARALDSKGEILPIYKDQLAVLDRLLMMGSVAR